MEQKIQEIIERNKRVEIDKAWETSFFRKICVAILTYFVILIIFIILDIQKPFINAIIPTTWFILSTLSLWFLKKVWLKYFYKTN
ncbi:MAG: hypothetical protein ACD_49C00023G0014 [uncultured bacterium (gcode 4)]|uniref:2TM domain-containing protein n=1 Tax=uncultured bacterium (gcode 4) TaxID=1234023 RepID=K2AY48_9BACT|nr:MAG: hypothetical protein ACD_49C00023G0014 [uncultured bacterium (gcode 4)]